MILGNISCIILNKMIETTYKIKINENIEDNNHIKMMLIWT